MKLLDVNILYSHFCLYQYVLSLLLILCWYPGLKFLLRYLLGVFLRLFCILLFNFYVHFHIKHSPRIKFVHRGQNLTFLYSILMLTFNHLI